MAAAPSSISPDQTSPLPEMEKKRLSITQRRLSTNTLSKLTIPENRFPGTNSCPVNFSGDPFNPEDTVEEGKELFQHFVLDQISKEGLEAPQECFSPTVVKTPDHYKKSMWANMGRELRTMADKFEQTKERETVRDKANKVRLQEITQDKFFVMLTNLFPEGRVTNERVMVLFFFCSDLAIRSLAQKFIDIFKRLIQWSLAYISEQVCAWVQREGGWGAVIVGGANPFLQKILIGVVICAVSYGFYKWFQRNNS